MRDRETDEALRLEAIDLVAKAHTTDAIDAHRLAHEAWRRRSARHELAWIEAERAWALMAGLSSATRPTSAARSKWTVRPEAPARPRSAASVRTRATRPKPPTSPASAEPARRRRRAAHWWLAACAAASLVVAALGGLAGSPLERVRTAQHGIASQAPAVEREYRSPGRRGSVSLEDGSTVHLNAGTVLAVRVDAASRRVELVRGEAVFDVAKDPARPFVVEAGGARAAALGTVFMVRRLRDRAARVTVLEGRVAVAAGAAELELHADESVEATGASLGPRRAVDAEDAAAWRRGMLVFREQALDEVLAEIDRYTPYRIDAQLGSSAAERVTGTFFIDRPDESLSALIQSFGLVAVASEPGRLRLERERPSRSR